MITGRNGQTVESMTKDFGYTLVARTVNCILNPGTVNVADLFDTVSGWEPRAMAALDSLLDEMVGAGWLGERDAGGGEYAVWLTESGRRFAHEFVGGVAR